MLTEVKSSQSSTLKGTPSGQYMETRVYRNAESSAALPFGVPVKRTTAADDCLKCAAETDVIAGFVLRDEKYFAALENTDDGLVAGATMTVMERGEMHLLCEVAMTLGDPVFIRVVAGAGETYGAVRKTADSTDTVDCSGWAKVVKPGAAGSTCVVKFDTLFAQSVSSGA